RTFFQTRLFQCATIVIFDNTGVYHRVQNPIFGFALGVKYLIDKRNCILRLQDSYPSQWEIKRISTRNQLHGKVLHALIEAFFSATVELRDGCVPPIRISLAISLWHCPHRSQRASDTGRLRSWRTTSQWKSQTAVSPRIAMDYRPQVRDESWMRIK